MISKEIQVKGNVHRIYHVNMHKHKYVLIFVNCEKRL